MLDRVYIDFGRGKSHCILHLGNKAIDGEAVLGLHAFSGNDYVFLVVREEMLG